MRTDKFVVTENALACSSMVAALLRKPSRLERMAVAYGKWGLGKSTVLEWIFTNMPCFIAFSLAVWTRSANTMVEDLLRCYRVEGRGRLKHDFRELVNVAKKRGHPLFIDEADRVVRKSLLIEIIRDLHDMARIPIILVGSENLINLLQRHDLGHVYSRVTETVEFQELTAADIERVAIELCGLQCSAKVATFIRTVTLGDFRLLDALLIRAEDICVFNKCSEITLQIAKQASSSGSYREQVETLTRDAITDQSATAETLRAAG